MANVLIVAGNHFNLPAAFLLQERLLNRKGIEQAHVVRENWIDYMDQSSVQFNRLIFLGNEDPGRVRVMNPEIYARSHWRHYSPKLDVVINKPGMSFYFLMTDRNCLRHPGLDSGRWKILKLLSSTGEHCYRLEYYGMTLNESVLQMEKDLQTILDFKA